MENQKNKKNEKEATVSAAIRAMCSKSFGVLDSNFLCKSLSMMHPPEPLCLGEDATVAQAVEEMQKHKIGCILVVDRQRKLVGIFTERDCMLKIIGKEIDLKSTPIVDLMTRDPVSERPDTTTAYALNLMSQGGFRHLPLVDADKVPIGIISIKNIVDFIVDTLTTDLLNFALEESSN